MGIIGSGWIRYALIAVIAVLVFGAGYQFSNTQHAKQDAKDAKVVANEIARLSREHTDKLRELALVGADKERIFTSDIAEINLHRDALLEQIQTAQLTKPVAEVRIEACLEGDEDVQIVVANPFSDSFRVLWNQAARNLRPSGSTGADPE